MGRYKNIIDIQQGGEHGRTALHLAAIYDHEECARILVSLCNVRHFYYWRFIVMYLFFRNCVFNFINIVLSVQKLEKDFGNCVL